MGCVDAGVWSFFFSPRVEWLAALEKLIAAFSEHSLGVCS